MELPAKKLSREELTEIADEAKAGLLTLPMLKLLRHIEWQDDEIERLREDIDTRRDRDMEVKYGVSRAR